MRYLSLFSGIGGFEKAIHNVLPDAECVGFSEIDKYARSIYLRHFPEHRDYGNATTIISDRLADFDLLVGGFPCQTFSIAGNRAGFDDVRGTLFFEIARILRDKRPGCFLLENVDGLLSHESGKTFQTILGILSGLGYRVEWQVLNSKYFGIPQNRNRVFIAGCSSRSGRRQILPVEPGHGIPEAPATGKQKGKTQICSTIDSRYGSLRNGGETYVGTLRTHKDGQGFRAMKENVSPALNARARQDGSGQAVIFQRPRKFNSSMEHNDYLLANAVLRRFTPVECERLQGFDDDWTKYGHDGSVISDTQRYKCLGNAVTVNVVEVLIKRLVTMQNKY